MRLTKNYLFFEEEDKGQLIAHHRYRSANLARTFTSYREEDTDLASFMLREYNMRLGNHELFVFPEYTLKYTDGKVLVGKTTDVYKGGWEPPFSSPEEMVYLHRN